MRQVMEAREEALNLELRIKDQLCSELNLLVQQSAHAQVCHHAYHHAYHHACRNYHHAYNCAYHNACRSYDRHNCSRSHVCERSYTPHPHTHTRACTLFTFMSNVFLISFPYGRKMQRQQSDHWKTIWDCTGISAQDREGSVALEAPLHC